MRGRAAFAGVLLVAAAGCGVGGPAARPEAVAPSATTRFASGPSRYGVTFLPAYQGDRLWTNLRDLGAGWVRVDLWLGDPRHEERFGPMVERAIDEGYGVWVTMYHRDPSNVDSARLGRANRGGLPALDAARTQDLVRRTIRPWVERIRSRGGNVADRIVIQVENEVAPEEIAPTNPNRFWHGTSDQYFAHLGATYDAVKSVDSGIPVALAGFASEGLEWAIAPNAAGGGPVAAAWMERMLAEGRYDLVDVHLYHRIETIPAKFAWVRARTSRPIAATEVGGPDARAGARYSDEANAVDLAARIPAVLGAGATHVMWLGMAEAPTADRLGATVALTRTDAGRKPSYDAYQRLIRGAAR